MRSCGAKRTPSYTRDAFVSDDDAPRASTVDPAAHAADHHPPTWYLLFQGLLGLVEFAIGLAMVADYRRADVWEAF